MFASSCERGIMRAAVHELSCLHTYEQTDRRTEKHQLKTILSLLPQTVNTRPIGPRVICSAVA